MSTIPNSNARIAPPTKARLRRSRWTRIAAILGNLLLVSAAAVLVTQVAWRTTPSSHAAASAPRRSAPPSPAAPGFGTPTPGFPGFGFGTPMPNAPGTSSNSNASGGPANAAAIAKQVDAGLVDINTALGYQSEEAAGTGMVLTKSGEVLTNNHVIENATSIRATDIGNGKTYDVRVLGYSRTNDVALLQLVNATNLTKVRLGSSSEVHVGDAVVGIGNAGGTGGTPSYAGGSITALHQAITAGDEGDGTTERLTGLMGTNAGIEPGDSGGPLVNTNGYVVGMDTAASAGFEFEPSSGSNTQAYSIPIDSALALAHDIKSGANSSTVHVGPTAFLGVEVSSPGASGGFGGFGSFGGGYGFGTPSSTPSSGAEIVTAFSGSPASQAGLTEGDTITSFAGKAVSSPNSLTTLIEAQKPSAAVALAYVDPSGQRHTITVHLGSGPPQ